jgi:hypothetical protein
VRPRASPPTTAADQHREHAHAQRNIRYNNIIDSDEARLAQAAADEAPNLPSSLIDQTKFSMHAALPQVHAGETMRCGATCPAAVGRAGAAGEPHVHRRASDPATERGPDATAARHDALVALHAGGRHGVGGGHEARGHQPVPGRGVELGEPCGAGLSPAQEFFACLAKRRFPSDARC